MNLFSEKSFANFEFQTLKNLHDHIKSCDSFDETLDEEVSLMAKEFQFQSLKLDTGDYAHNIYMLSVPVDYNRGEMSTTGKKNIAVVEYTYNLITDFDEKQKRLLGVRPNHYNNSMVNLIVNGYNAKQIQFIIPTRYSTIELPDAVIQEVIKQRDIILNVIKTNTDSLNEDIARLNANIHGACLEFISERKSHLDKMKEIRSKL